MERSGHPRDAPELYALAKRIWVITYRFEPSADRTTFERIAENREDLQACVFVLSQSLVDGRKLGQG